MRISDWSSDVCSSDLVPSPKEGQAGEGDAPGVLLNFLESRDPLVLDYGDNLTVSPQGHLIVSEDKSGTHINHLKMITPTGTSFTLARNARKESAEFAGVCHSSAGGTMFVNIYDPGTSEEPTSEIKSLMRISYAVFCLNNTMRIA